MQKVVDTIGMAVSDLVVSGQSRMPSDSKIFKFFYSLNANNNGKRSASQYFPLLVFVRFHFLPRFNIDFSGNCRCYASDA